MVQRMNTCHITDLAGVEPAFRGTGPTMELRIQPGVERGSSRKARSFSLQDFHSGLVDPDGRRYSPEVLAEFPDGGEHPSRPWGQLPLPAEALIERFRVPPEDEPNPPRIGTVSSAGNSLHGLTPLKKL